MELLPFNTCKASFETAQQFFIPASEKVTADIQLDGEVYVQNMLTIPGCELMATARVVNGKPSARFAVSFGWATYRDYSHSHGNQFVLAKLGR